MEHYNLTEIRKGALFCVLSERIFLYIEDKMRLYLFSNFVVENSFVYASTISSTNILHNQFLKLSESICNIIQQDFCWKLHMDCKKINLMGVESFAH